MITKDISAVEYHMDEKEEDEPTIPRAVINKILKETIPNVRVASETRELILNCCSEFIHHISTEAYKICSQSEKKTIVPEHIIIALENLGFHSYLPEVNTVLVDCKDKVAKRRGKSNRLENLGIPEEELLRQQEELFAKARMEQASIEQKQWLHFQNNSMLMQNSNSSNVSLIGMAFNENNIGPNEDEESDFD